MTETSDSGNYSQYEGSSENNSETFAQQSSTIISSYQMSDEGDSDESDDSDYEDSENVKNVDQTSVYSWVIITSISII
jgi:hypothetical protein